MDLYIYSAIRLHGVVLNYLSTGTTLPFTLPSLTSSEKHKKGIHYYMNVESLLVAGPVITMIVIANPARAQCLFTLYTEQ
jgi:uncharacterized membrane protein